MGPEGVVLPASAISQGLGLGNRGEELRMWPPADFVYGNSSLNRLLNDSAQSFGHGNPSSMQA